MDSHAADGGLPAAPLPPIVLPALPPLSEPPLPALALPPDEPAAPPFETPPPPELEPALPPLEELPALPPPLAVPPNALGLPPFVLPPPPCEVVEPALLLLPPAPARDPPEFVPLAFSSSGASIAVAHATASRPCARKIREASWRMSNPNVRAASALDGSTRSHDQNGQKLASPSPAASNLADLAIDGAQQLGGVTLGRDLRERSLDLAVGTDHEADTAGATVLERNPERAS